MSLSQHIESLKEKHRYFDDLLREETKHLSSDSRNSTLLKLKKLHIKEEIESLTPFIS